MALAVKDVHITRPADLDVHDGLSDRFDSLLRNSNIEHSHDFLCPIKDRLIDCGIPAADNQSPSLI